LRRAALPAFAAGLLLAACTVPPDQPVDPLAGIAPRPLAVSYVDVGEAFAPGTGGTFIDKRHTTELVDAARRYAQTRLVPAGGASSASVAILQAQVVAEPRAPAGGLTSAVTREPDSALQGVLEMKITPVGSDGLEHGSASARVERTRAVLEMTSVLERDRLAGQMIHDLLVDLDKALGASIRQNLPQLASP
jgi:hypothetical protein